MHLPIPTGEPVCDTGDAARIFLEYYKDLFRLKDPSEELVLGKVGKIGDGAFRVEFRQLHEGLSVFGSGPVLYLDENNEITGIGGFYVPDIDVTTRPIVTGDDVYNIARSEAESLSLFTRGVIPDVELLDSPELGIFDPELFNGEPGEPVLAWKVTISLDDLDTRDFYVDGMSGNLIHDEYHMQQNENERWSGGKAGMDPKETGGGLIRRLLDNECSSSLPDRLVPICGEGEGDCCNDASTGQRKPDDAPRGRDACSTLGWPLEATDSWEYLSAALDYCDHIGADGGGWSEDGSVTTIYNVTWPWSEGDCLNCNVNAMYSGDEGGDITDLSLQVGSGAACFDYIATGVIHLLPLLDGGITGFMGPYKESIGLGFDWSAAQYAENWFYGETDWKVGTCGDPSMGDDCTEPPDGKCPCKLGLADPSQWIYEDPILEDGPYPDHFNTFLERETCGDLPCPRNGAIVGKSFYLLAAATDNEEFMGIDVDGIGCIKAQNIWLVARRELDSTPDFTEFRWAMLESALRLYGHGIEFEQASNAADAVGTWTGDVEECGTEVSGVPSAAVFTVRGEDRRYIFYRDDMKWIVRCRYKSLPFEYDSCDYWGEELEWPEIPRMRTSESPSVCVYDGKLWVFYTGVFTNRVYYRYMKSNGKWSSLGMVSEVETDDAPATAVFNGKIHVFYRESDTGDIHYSTYDPKSRWSDPVDAGFNASYIPAVAAPLVEKKRERLFLFYGDGSDTLCYRTMEKSGEISEEYVVPHGAMTMKTPAVSIFRNRVHVVTKGDSNNSNGLNYISFGGAWDEESARGWSQYVKLSPGFGGDVSLFADPGLTEDSGDDRLFLFHSDPASHILFARSKRSK